MPLELHVCRESLAIHFLATLKTPPRDCIVLVSQSFKKPHLQLNHLNIDNIKEFVCANVCAILDHFLKKCLSHNTVLQSLHPTSSEKIVSADIRVNLSCAKMSMPQHNITVPISSENQLIFLTF